MHVICFIDLCSDQHKSFDPRYGFITISWNYKINHISTVFGDHYTNILKASIVYCISNDCQNSVIMTLLWAARNQGNGMSPGSPLHQSAKTPCSRCRRGAKCHQGYQGYVETTQIKLPPARENLEITRTGR